MSSIYIYIIFLYICSVSPSNNYKLSSSSSSKHQEQDLIDLSEWCNHRVLAKRNNIYVPGVIKTSNITNAVIVEFDYPEGTRQTYYDIFNAGRFDIICDASPSLSDVRY